MLRRIAIAGIACALSSSALGQSSVTSPLKFFGHSIGEDYWLANYRQLSDYFAKIDSQSERVRVVSIGKTEEGREQLMAIVSSPANHRKLDRLRSIARKLALGEFTDLAEAKRLAKEGKAVVWIDGGLHATEVLGAQQLIETLYYLASRDDEETKRILEDCIVLIVHANPDGMDLVSDWYMRRSDPKERSMAGVPRLYQKYVGHDNNRDFYASTQAETTNMNRILYREWFPQILYNHHQTAPAGTVIFAPPFRSPFNYHVDPLVEVMTSMVGIAMHNRFVAEGKPGAVMRNAASYQTWWNGGLRTTAYFHNMVGILTEAFGSPTPSRINFVANKLVPTTDVPFPIEPQEWRFRQSIEYELTANYAILDYASRYRETLLLNRGLMARNAIERGKIDSWTFYPERVEAAAAANGGLAGIKTSANRDAKAYVVPIEQADFGTATKFVNTLIKNGVDVHVAEEPFSVNGKRYGAGSWVVLASQAYRAHVLDMFEPQDYPNDFQYAGGPPIAPYDSAGYTPAFTMGIAFDRILDPFTASLKRVEGFAVPPPGTVSSNRGQPAGYLLDPAKNDTYAIVNALLKQKFEVLRVVADSPAAQPVARPGQFFVPDATGVRTQLAGLAAKMGVDVEGASNRPPNRMAALRTARIALWDRYGGSMTSGWTRWILEQWGFDFEQVFPPEIDAGALSNFDVLVLPSDASFGGGGRSESALAQDTTVPEVWRRRMGALSTDISAPKVREFLESGGTVVAVGDAYALIRALQLPVADALVETVNGQTRRLPREKFYVPASVLKVRVDPSMPAAWGMREWADVLFDESPAYRFLPDAEARGLKKIAWYEGDSPLRSGWAWGQKALNGSLAGFEAPVGKGRLLVFGPEITFRAQPHGTFRLLFNALYSNRN